MQAFELCFNPKKKDDLFLTSFLYVPTNIYEKRLGNLYVVGELTQAMPQNSHFLANLTSVIKKEYYSAGLKKSCEVSLQEALKKGNEFLEQESKRGNVGWLGNLNFSILCFKEPILNFAKAGDVKIFLVRANELVDISQNLEAGLPHPDPLKAFGSMAEGKLVADDKIIVLSKRILSAFGKKQNFLAELAKVSDEKGLKQVLKANQDTLAGLSGNCLFLKATSKDSEQSVLWQRDLPNFIFSQNIVKPITRFFTRKWPRPKIEIKLPRLRAPKISLPRFTRPTLPKLPGINLAFHRKKIFLVIGLVLVLFSFYYLFRGEKARELSEAQVQLAAASSKAMMAENLLILKEDVKAKELFEETLRILAPLTKRGCPLREEALSLQNSVKQYLK